MDQIYMTSQVSNILIIVDTCDVGIQLYLECTNSTLPSTVLDNLIGKKCLFETQFSKKCAKTKNKKAEFNFL